MSEPDDAYRPDDDGTEDEDTGQGESPHPFDPNLIRVKKIDPTVSNLMEKLAAGEIDLAPEFQRKKGIWDRGRQSRLIESLLIRIPLPAFYLDELPPEPGLDERFAVIDGVQRLTALERFINEKDESVRLHLADLEFLTQLNQKNFDDLDPSLRRRILGAQFVAYVVEPGTPDDAKLNIFKRINTGGMTLTAQEIRHAMNRGPVRKFLEELVGTEEFGEAVGPSAAKSMARRMADRECATRFLAFIDGGAHRYRSANTDFDGFLNKAMVRINETAENERNELAHRFRRAMAAAHASFGHHAFRKPDAGGRGPLNKALFEATSVALDACTDEDLTKVEARRERLLGAYTRAFGDAVVLGSVTASTGDPIRVVRRFDALRDVIAEVLG